jgi:hypothetical protein
MTIAIRSFIFCFSALLAPLCAAPVVYEGFDIAGAPAALGSAAARAGTTSHGWLSHWHLKEGASRVLRDDLALAGLQSTPGLTSSKGKTIVMRQLAESMAGDVYGSFRVRGSQLNANSMMGLLISLPDTDPLTPQTALISLLASRWASGLGAILVGGKPVPIESGEALTAKETAIVLWKMENLPAPGKSANVVIRMWILNEQQAGHFAATGMRERDLRRAKSGRDPQQVMQSGEVALRGSKFSMLKGLVISCFSNGVPKADFDEIRISTTSLAEAAGVGNPTADH